MGPEMMIISAVASAASSMVGAIGQSQAMNAQADADRQRADIQKQWADRRALEERVAGQRAADEEGRKAKIAQSRLTALSGAAGTRPDDQGIMDLWGDIGKEGDYNAAQATAATEQKASGIEYQASLDQWTADANARIKKAAAKTTLIGGLIGAGGQLAGGMAGRYGGGRSSVGTGYGRFS